MAIIKAKISRKEAEKYQPRFAEYGSSKPWIEGDHVAYNAGVYGWNWDLIFYRGRFYVAGYRSFPKTVGRYEGE